MKREPGKEASPGPDKPGLRRNPSDWLCKSHTTPSSRHRSVSPPPLPRRSLRPLPALWLPRAASRTSIPGIAFRLTFFFPFLSKAGPIPVREQPPSFPSFIQVTPEERTNPPSQPRTNAQQQSVCSGGAVTALSVFRSHSGTKSHQRRATKAICGEICTLAHVRT